VNLSQFLLSRRDAWRETEALLHQAEEREISDLTHARAKRLVDLYRRASADLVQARTFGAGIDVTGYLEGLVGRGFAFLYQAPPLSGWRKVFSFFRDRFPRAVRKERAAFLLVLAAFVSGLVLGGVATALDPEARGLFVPTEHQHLRPSERVAQAEASESKGTRGLDLNDHAAFSSFLFTHNIGVSIIAFAVGIAWGLPTLLFVAYHGVFIAALAVDYWRDGVALFFFAWILPHGIVEMTSMLLSGTAGVLLGRGVLWPRGKPRSVRVREEAKTSLDLLGGAAALLVLAGLVEGTLSQIHEPTLHYSWKIGFALIFGSVVHAYLWFLPLQDPPHMAPRALSSK
jgi:uncharacterized membrane protein SpoIIM required for sporulation